MRISRADEKKKKLGGFKYYRKMLEQARESSPVAKQIELVRCEILTLFLTLLVGCSTYFLRSCLVGHLRRTKIARERSFSVFHA